MIVIVAHDPSWPLAFDREARRLRAQFGVRAIRIDHVGSTAVPGLDAKPVIDIQVSLASLEPRTSIEQDLHALGYTHVDLGDFDLVYPFFTAPARWPSTHHVHLCVAGSEQERAHLAFRDVLRAHAALAQDYLRLKHELARRHGGHSPESREAYSLAKSDFVRAALARAYSEGLPRHGRSDG